MNRLQNKVAVITGGGSGIGLATAGLFAEEGAHVTVFDIHPSAANSIRVDVTSPHEVERAVNDVFERYGRLDILVNVAGGSGRKWGDGPAPAADRRLWLAEGGRVRSTVSGIG